MAGLAIAASHLDKLDKLQSNAMNSMNNASSVSGIGKVNSIFTAGVNSSNKARALSMNTSIFDIARSQETQSSSAQSGTMQKTGADASSMSVSFMSLVDSAKSSFESVINAIKDLTQTASAEASALASTPTSGQTVNPEDNMPTDNKGSEEKAANPSDSQKPNVGFGEETVSNKPENSTEEETEVKTEDEEPKTMSEIDQQTVKQNEEQKLEEAKKKAEEEEKIRRETAQA